MQCLVGGCTECHGDGFTIYINGTCAECAETCLTCNGEDCVTCKNPQHSLTPIDSVMGCKDCQVFGKFCTKCNENKCEHCDNTHYFV